MAGEVYEQLTDRPLPDTRTPEPAEPMGHEWQEDELPALLPRLWKKYGG